MSSTPNSLRFEDNIGLVHLQTKVGHSWAARAGARMEYDDVFQEASLAFLLAVEGFNPDAGVKFSAYYTKVAFSCFKKMVGRETGVKNLSMTQRSEVADRKALNSKRASEGLPQLEDMNYGVRPVSFSELGYEDGDPFEDTIASETHTPEDLVAHRQVLEQATAKLSPLTQLVVEWLQNPPEELLAELRAQEAHVEECSMRGIRVRNKADLNVNNISRFIELAGGKVTAYDLALVKHELKELTEALEA
jgi:hypothetical protein